VFEISNIRDLNPCVFKGFREFEAMIKKHMAGVEANKVKHENFAEIQTA
jgi:hypothetical protein